MAFIAPTAGRVDIDIAIALARFLESPLCRPSPSSRRRLRAVPRRRAAPSITLNSPSRRPSLPIAIVLTVHRRRARTVPRRRGAVAPSIAIEEPWLAPSIAVTVEEPSRCPLPSPSMSHRVVPRHRGAIVPTIAVEEPSRRTSPSRSSCLAGCHVSSLLTPPPPICRRLCLSLSSRHRRLLSRPSCS
jgi:hypothetical protein